MNIMERALAEYIIEARRVKGWGQRELARRAGISGGTISNLESGATQPTNNTIVRIALAMNEDPQHLLRLAGHLPAAPPVTDLGEAVCQTFRMLSVEQQRAVARIVFDMAGVEAAGVSVSGSRQAQAGQGGQNDALNHRDAVSASTQLPIPKAMAGDCNPDPYQALRRALELVWETAPREERGRYFLQTAIDILYEGQRGSHDE